uniref:Uncharacterized protein n=1 Tax=Leptobrachium leishanense TaxID=445787 RepID=A0A8C5R6W4_9ANUR
MSHPAHTNKVAPQAGHFRGAPSGPYLQAGNGNSEQCIPYGTMRDWQYLFSQQWGMMSNPTDFFNAMFQWFSAGAKGSGCPPPSSSPGQCPDVPVQPGLKAFTAGSFFGGGFTIRQKRNRKRKQSAPTTSPKEGEAAAEKQANCTDDPETKYEGSETDGDEDAETVEKGTKTDVEVKESDEKAVVAETGNEDKVVPEKSQQDPQDKCSREQIMQIQFVCTLCNFRTFYDEDITHHVQSDFHKEHLLHMRSQFPNQTADFLEVRLSTNHVKGYLHFLFGSQIRHHQIPSGVIFFAES